MMQRLVNLIRKRFEAMPRNPWYVVAGVVVLGALGVLVTPTPAHALDLATISVNAVGNLIKPIVFIIVTFLGNVVLLVINITLWIANYNGFADAQIVVDGWKTVRDIANLFFIIILLVMAFGTVLNLQSYHARSLLGKFLIMVVLINFSRTIAAFMIDFSQVIMMTFVNAFRDAAPDLLANAVGIRELLNLPNQSGLEISNNDLARAADVVGALFFAVIILLSFLFVLGAIFIILLLRIIWLWILIILSPLAYLFEILPKTKSYATQWWSMFGKYVVVGPVMAFFLWLSLTFLSTTQDELPGEFRVAKEVLEQGSLPGVEPDFNEDVAGAVTPISTSSNTLRFALALAMLAASMTFAQQSGVAGAQFAASAVGRIRQLSLAPVAAGVGALKLGGRGLKAGTKALAESVSPIELSPEEWKKGWQVAQKRRQDRRRDKMRARSKKIFGDTSAAKLASPADFWEEFGGGHGLKNVFTKGLFNRNYKKQQEEEKGLEAEEKRTREEREAAEQELDTHVSEGQSNEIKEQIKKNQELVASLPPDAFQRGGMILERNSNTEEFLRNQEKHVREMAEELRKDGRVEEEQSMLAVARTIANALEKQDDPEIVINLPDDLKVTTTELDEKGNKKKGVRQVDEMFALAGQQERSKAAAEVFQGQARLDSSVIVSDQQAEANEAEAKRAEEQHKAAQKVLAIHRNEMVKTRPKVSIEERLEQRKRTSEEKSRMAGIDDWHELKDYLEEAIEQKDFVRAAAAYQKATEDGNENEIQNWWGFDSSAQGMKEFIMTYFVGEKGGFNKEMADEMEIDWGKVKDHVKKGMGMSSEQALAMASDISHIAEKNMHWEVARAVTSQGGKLKWQNAEDRYIEQLAEIRKLDFENFNRRANRLSHMIEEAEGDTVEERAQNFRATGKRGSRISPFGLTWFAENFDKYKDLIPRGRYNPSVSVNVTSPDNLSIIDSFLTQTHPDKADTWHGAMRGQLLQYAGGVQAGLPSEFRGLKDAYKSLSSQRGGKV